MTYCNIIPLLYRTVLLLYTIFVYIPQQTKDSFENNTILYVILANVWYDTVWKYCIALYTEKIT